MTDLAPVDTTLTIHDLNSGPFPIYQRLRRDTPVLRVKTLGRTLLSKAADTRYVKENPELFSSDDPNTPMKRAFQAHTLMRKDGDAHMRERMAMAPAFAPSVITNEWMPRYEQIAAEYVARLPKGEVVDLFPALSGPYAARGLAVLLGLEDATASRTTIWPTPTTPRCLSC
jgi:cytochrome P450